MKDAGKKVFRKGGIHEVRDAGKKGCRKERKKDARKEGFMKGGIHEVRDAGKKGFRRLVMQNLFMKLRKNGFCRHCCVQQS